jgi:serine/threonine protein kinase/tetratricopeptide (TPR) repeat protein
MSNILEPGTALGGYRIERLLGRGGMGAVFLAYDTTLHRRVALKVMDDAAEGETSRGLLLREGRNAAALNHPNICTVHEIGHASGTTFIAMEYVEGGSLRERINEQGALAPEDVLRYGHQAAEALAYAHEHGVVHRDFKAANAMITADGRLKVVDFGLARRSDALIASATTVASLAPAGVIAGTPYAMAPEQVRGEPADARTDLWALGVLLHEMATGGAPFAGATQPELFAAILTSAPAAPPTSVSAELREVIERCLEKSPGRRYAHAREVRAAIGAIQTGTVAPWVTLRYHARQRPVLSAFAVLLALTVGFVGANVGGVRDRLVGVTPATALVKLAVLPFENLTGDPSQEYFTDGLTDEMITQLGRLHPERLKVIARSSAMQYKTQTAPIDAIGRDLGVDYVLEGSARREGSRVRISASLIQVSDRTQRWSQSFDRDLAGILALQNDVARGVAGALALALLPAEQARLATAPQVNPRAYEAYLIGRSHVQRLTKGDLDRALEYFETAVRLDPDFALGHFGIASVWAGRVQTGLVRPDEEQGRGRTSLKRAMELDDALPEVHVALANGQTWVDWEWAAAEASFRRALDLNPSHAEAHAFYSHYLYIRHRPLEGAAAIARALELDPLNDLIQQFYGMTLTFTGRFEEGIAHAQRVLQTNPNSPSAWNALTANHHQLGRYEESLSAQRRAIGARGAAAEEALSRLNQGYEEGGYAGALRQLAQLRAARRQDWAAAQLYIRAGQPEQALDALERAYEERNSNLPYISVGSVFADLRGHPRFQALLQRMNLPN